ncbi:hypothetical protein V1511DRAFT_494993 [Dipodascopsis uninucleata]
MDGDDRPRILRQQHQRQQQAQQQVFNTPASVDSSRPSSPMSMSTVTLPATPMSARRLHQSHSMSSLSPSTSGTGSMLTVPVVFTPGSNNTQGLLSTGNGGSKSNGNRRLSLSLNLTKPLRCTSLHQSIVPSSPEASVANSPRSRGNSISGSLSTRHGIDTAQSPSGSIPFMTPTLGSDSKENSSSDEEEAATKSAFSTDCTSRNFDSSDSRGYFSFVRSHSQLNKPILNDSTETNKPRLTIPSLNHGDPYLFRSSPFLSAVSNESSTTGLESSTINTNSKDAIHHAYSPNSSSESPHPPRRAVVFSRNGSGPSKPQTKSFLRITRELADEFAPVEAEIKHEAEVTMAFRDDADDDDDYEDDDDDDKLFGRHPSQSNQDSWETFKSPFTGIPRFRNRFLASSGKLLESPPLHKRSLLDNFTGGYLSDNNRFEDEDDLNDTDDGRRDDSGSSINLLSTSANASPVTGPMFVQTMKRASEGWESPLSTSPIGSVGLDRRLKRRGTDDRFEPYSFKRRAVSPGLGGSTPPPIGTPSSFAAGKRSMKQMQDTYDRIQKMTIN